VNRVATRSLALLTVAVLLAGCGRGQTPPAAGAPSAIAGATTNPPVAPRVAVATAAAGPVGLPGRSREVVNPDNSTMVFLYFDLAGLKPPVDDWVESDNRVRSAAPADKAARRAAVRAEFESGIAAAHGIGRIRVSLGDANLSDYDPAYGEFTVRALAPSSELSCDALGQKVATRFANGETAQLWRVPADQAQAVRDRTSGRRVGLDAVLRVTGVQPGPGGGAVITEIEEYTLRAQDGSTLARITAAPS
jgi:hypothetical protein